ncbi:MAG TPA: SpoIIE family protein phosphatase [Candidatus Polarisedimenticolia bacterium]|nr:SpoIIE family protein phosphatase [Candidatus Polarisedimenticolia bacterium]
MKARILVVDDQPGMLRAVQRVLGPRHSVASFTSAREALASATRLEPDLAILDIRLPDIDGFELLGRLKRTVPGLDAILMTGSMTDVDQKVIRSIRENAFYFIQKPFDSELLRTLVERCLEQRALREQNRAHIRRLQDELSEARAFQQSLLPPAEATVAGVALSCRLRPCTELAGDLYDYALCGGGRAAMMVADVSGHGGSAAMLTGLVKSSFHGAIGGGQAPEAVAAAIASALGPFGPGRFVTLICLCVDAAAGRIDYVNAGHPPGILWGDSRPAVELPPTGPIVSPALDGASWVRRSVPAGPGDRWLLYTDGLTEASTDHAFFGDQRLRDVVRRHPQGGAPLLEGLLAAETEFRAGRPPADDLTLLAAVLTG